MGNEGPEESVLIIEDSDTYRSELERIIKQELGVQAVCVPTLAAAKDVLLASNVSFFAAVVDIHLPDAHDAEAVALTLSYRLPTVVLTSSEDRSTRDKVLRMKILDFLVKGGRAIEMLLSILRRVRRHRSIQVLVVDDAKTSRGMVRKFLERFRYQVLEAASGIEALALLSSNPGIKLVITDFHMPGMDGFELISRIRMSHGLDELAVIGLSSSDSEELTSQFLKMGANDFLYKGFSIDEFYCRVRQNIELVERFEEIKEVSNRDYLTGLYNRRYFFKQGADLVEICRRAQSPVAVAILDLDHFKTINDTYGHEAGDRVLREFGAFLLKNSRSSDLVARFGGEEFCFLASNTSTAHAPMFFKRLCWSLSQMEIPFGSTHLKITMSIGVAMVTGRLEDAIKEADVALYKAKQEGRNRVVLSAHPH